MKIQSGPEWTGKKGKTGRESARLTRGLRKLPEGVLEPEWAGTVVSQEWACLSFPEKRSPWKRGSGYRSSSCGGSLERWAHLSPCRCQHGWTQRAGGLGRKDPVLSPWPGYNESAPSGRWWPPLRGFWVQKQLSFPLAASLESVKTGLKKASPHSKVGTQ